MGQWVTIPTNGYTFLVVGCQQPSHQLTALHTRNHPWKTWVYRFHHVQCRGWLLKLDGNSSSVAAYNICWVASMELRILGATPQGYTKVMNKVITSCNDVQRCGWFIMTCSNQKSDQSLPGNCHRIASSTAVGNLSLVQVCSAGGWMIIKHHQTWIGEHPNSGSRAPSIGHWSSLQLGNHDQWWPMTKMVTLAEINCNQRYGWSNDPPSWWSPMTKIMAFGRFPTATRGTVRWEAMVGR